MDSVSQFVLGAAVGVWVSPKKTPKIALISGLIATIPDLDIFLDYGNDLLNTVNHRGFSHSLFYLTLFAPFLAVILFKFVKTLSFYRWLVLVWLVLVTHALLDSFTIYGTALFLPFSEKRVMLGSIFIIDPIYTLPLVFSLIYLLSRKSAKFNYLVLMFSTIYLIWSVLAQYIVLSHRGLESVRSFATPTPFNTYLWRTVSVDEKYISQEFVYFIDALKLGDFYIQKTIPKDIKNNQDLFTNDYIKHYANFSSGFYNLKVDGDKLILYDLRMGTIFNPVFRFVVAQKVGEEWQSIMPYKLKTERSFKGMFGDGR